MCMRVETPMSTEKKKTTRQQRLLNNNSQMDTDSYAHVTINNSEIQRQNCTEKLNSAERNETRKDFKENKINQSV